jgi:hypothetical protein
MGCNGAAVVSFFREIIVSSRRPLIPTVRRLRTMRRECAFQDLTVIVEFAKLVTLMSLQTNERWRRRAT